MIGDFLRSPARRYCAVALAGTFALLAATMSINVLVDPLWYFAGNRISHKNLPFNEREGKANLFYAQRERYDCVLFGSSSATTIDVTRVGTHGCFNFALSAGTLEEAVAYARYVKAVGKAPTMVIVAIDEFNLREGAPPPQVPKYVRALEPPVSFLDVYLSVGVIRHSLGELMDPRYETRRFYRTSDRVCVLAPDHPQYRPEAVIHRSSDPVRHDTANLHSIDELRRVFPEARLIGYVPYQSAWLTARDHYEGQLEQIVAARHAAAEKFDAFYDFAMPSPQTEATGETVDGIHYSVGANTEIVRALAGAPTPETVQPAGLASSDYLELYRSRLAQFTASHNVSVAPR